MMKIPTSLISVSSSEPQNIVTLIRQDANIDNIEWNVTANLPHNFLPLFMILWYKVPQEPLRWLRYWSICHMRRGWKSWGCLALLRGVLIHVNKYLMGEVNKTEQETSQQRTPSLAICLIEPALNRGAGLHRQWAGLKTGWTASLKRLWSATKSPAGAQSLLKYPKGW